MLRYSLIGLVVVALAAPFGSAGGKLNPVKVDAKAVKSTGDKQVVVVELKIDKGWHVYANPADNEQLAGAETKVQVNAAGKKVPATIKYPPGKEHDDKDVGKYKIYENKVVIPVEFTRTDAAVEVSVTYQACDAKKCLQPKTVKINVK